MSGRSGLLPVAPDGLHPLDDAIHTLAQPLTALLFVVEIALLQNSPEAARKALQTAQVECRRAIDALESVRSAAACIPKGETR